MGSKTALILGIGGQDGAYLARFLLKKGYNVIGTSRDAQISLFSNLKILGIFDAVQLESVSLTDFRSVLQVIKKTNPDEIYNLAGQTSVALSFEQPVETFDSISMGTLNLLEALRFFDQDIRFYNACSSECFGNTNGEPATEETPFHPRSPYAAAKAAAFWQVANYREAYSLFACSGILFNHESPLRPDRFVTKKIVNMACRIARGHKETLTLGNIDIYRDWGWAPEYVETMWLMLQQDQAQDLIIASGKTYGLKEFMAEVFSCFNLNWQDHVRLDPAYIRPTDIMESRACPKKVFEQLNWKARFAMPEVAGMMVAYQKQVI